MLLGFFFILFVSISSRRDIQKISFDDQEILRWESLPLLTCLDRWRFIESRGTGIAQTSSSKVRKSTIYM